MSRQAQWIGTIVGLLVALSIPWWVTSSFYMRLINFSGITIIAVVGLNFITGETGKPQGFYSGTYVKEGVGVIQRGNINNRRDGLD